MGKELKYAIFSIVRGATLVVYRGREWIIEGSGKPELVVSGDDSMIARKLAIKKRVISDNFKYSPDNKNGLLDLDWVIAEHKRNILRKTALKAVRIMCGSSREDLKRSEINWLNYNLSSGTVYHFVCCMLSIEMLGEVSDIDGAIKLAKEMKAGKVVEILEGRIKKLITGEAEPWEKMKV